MGLRLAEGRGREADFMRTRGEGGMARGVGRSTTEFIRTRGGDGGFATMVEDR